MKAIVVTDQAAGTAGMKLVERPEPQGAAGEVMTIVQLAMTAGLPYTALRDAILVHPTMAEGLARLFRALPARP